MKIKYFVCPDDSIFGACSQALMNHQFEVTSTQDHGASLRAAKEVTLSLNGSFTDLVDIKVKAVPSGKQKVKVHCVSYITCSADFERAKHLEKSIMSEIELLLLGDESVYNTSATG